MATPSTLTADHTDTRGLRSLPLIIFSFSFVLFVSFVANFFRTFEETKPQRTQRAQRIWKPECLRRWQRRPRGWL